VYLELPQDSNYNLGELLERMVHAANVDTVRAGEGEPEAGV
jgi:hypothetical protein